MNRTDPPLLTTDRLQKTLGSGTPPFAPQGSTNPSDNGTAIAETLWDLRLRYEETVVRLYACQSSVSAILRDPTRGNEDEWHGVGRALTSAVGSAGAGEGEQELWRKAEQLVKSITKGDPEGVADLGSTLPTSPNHHAGLFNDGRFESRARYGVASLGGRRQVAGQTPLLPRRLLALIHPPLLLPPYSHWSPPGGRSRVGIVTNGRRGRGWRVRGRQWR